MVDMVVDSNVWVAAFVQSDSHYQSASQFVEELRQGQHHCHVPYLVLAEICAAILRRVLQPRLAMGLVVQVRKRFRQWESTGIITWYELTWPRTVGAITLNLALSPHLRGADSIIAGLAEELGIPVKTYDEEMLQRYTKASS